jgi:alpha-glucosidase
MQGKPATQVASAPALDHDWWRGAVIYQIYPRSFQDSNGDGIGDLNGITERLGYVAALGADAIWISPFFTSPMLDFGYDVSDYRDVDPMFGSLADFRKLVARAHELGIRVIIDLVFSHTSDQHLWFQESRQSRENRYADWYVWADPKPDGTPPNNWLSLFGGCGWEWEARRRQYYFHNFLKQQPDLNFHCPAVQDELLSIARFWLDLGVDGFRLDTVNFYVHDKELRDNPPARNRESLEIPLANPYAWQDHVYDKSRPENLRFLERMRALMDEYGAITSVGEVGDAERSLQTMAAYTEGNRRLHMCYSFDFLSRAFGKAHVEKTIRDFERVAGGSWGCWAFSNHDVERHVSRWAVYGRDRLTFGRFTLALLMALRGSVCIYQGEELGLSEAEVPYELIQDPYGKVFWPEFKGRDGCRTPMAWDADKPNAGFSSANRTWLPVALDHPASAAIKAREENPETLLEDYRRFIRLRHAHEALRIGSIRIEESPGDVLAFGRQHGTESILCVFNFALSVARWPLPEGVEAKSLAEAGARLEGREIILDGNGAIYLTVTEGN